MYNDKLISFDIEICTEIPEDAENWDDYRPFGISCAAIAYRVNEDIKYLTWGDPEKRGPLESSELESLVSVLRVATGVGCKIVTVAGASFDFSVLAEESGDYETCVDICLNHHFDPCFMMLAKNGYMLGLDAMAKGAGVKSKLKKVVLKGGIVITDMSGIKAPGLWICGDGAAVLEYLKADVRATLETVEVIAEKKAIEWTSRSGREQRVEFENGLATVRECLDWELPDTSWMTNPMTRRQVLNWTGLYDSLEQEKLPF